MASVSFDQNRWLYRVISGATGGHSGRSAFWTQRAGSRKTNCSSPTLWARGSVWARHWHGLSFSSSLQVKFWFNEVNFNSFLGENYATENDRGTFPENSFMYRIFNSHLHLHVHLKCSHNSFGKGASLFLPLLFFSNSKQTTVDFTIVRHPNPPS